MEAGQQEYEPNIEGRHQGMLVGILSPTGWDTLHLQQFLTALSEWDLSVQNYESRVVSALVTRTLSVSS